MKDDHFGTFKTHKASDQALKPKKGSIQVKDPRPAGVGELLRSGASQLGECLYCGQPLDRSLNRDYLATVVGYCDKLHRASHERQLLKEGRLVIKDTYFDDDRGRCFTPPTKDWATGWWENITTEPVYIEDKKHLKQVCDKHGVMAKGLMKPKHSGRGYEMR